MSEQDAHKKKVNRFYEVIRGVSGLLFNTVMPVRYHGLENIQGDAPYILIGNHLHALDPFAIGWKLKGKQVVFLGKKEAMEKPVGKWFCSHLDMIPVDRHNSDLTAMRSCMKVIKTGGVLGIFPEGTRHHEGVMEQIESGTALIALRGKAPLQPVLINEKLRPFHTTHVYYGERMDITDLCAEGISNDVAERLNDRIRDVFRSLQAQTEKK